MTLSLISGIEVFDYWKKHLGIPLLHPSPERDPTKVPSFVLRQVT